MITPLSMFFATYVHFSQKSFAQGTRHPFLALTPPTTGTPMIFGAWIPPLAAALWSPLTGAVSVVLVLTELGARRPVRVPRISDASVASGSSRVAFIILGGFSAFFLWAAAVTVYSVLLAGGGGRGDRVSRWRRQPRGDAAGAGAGDERSAAPPPRLVPSWASHLALLCAAIASVALVVASSTNVFSGAHDNAVQLYVVAELVFLAVLLVALLRGRSRLGVPALIAALSALAGVAVGVVLLISSLLLIRGETGGANVVTPATLSAGERVPESVAVYFNLFSLGEYAFLLSLSALYLLLAWALRADKVHFGAVSAAAADAFVAAGAGGERGSEGAVLSSSALSDDAEGGEEGGRAQAAPPV
ncbi:hypothetical protein I4F81_001250 [Pyropia yezoensis]|uniref:Uncharacterized protein n=1 Tax=Pyropia yezoensis TaxID=2788 RepID=A0ACC3BKZ6_PYRYE|nr:hypothetical protein I4F81_001250 [Neopyropia yezoensis]